MRSRTENKCQPLYRQPRPWFVWFYEKNFSLLRNHLKNCFVILFVLNQILFCQTFSIHGTVSTNTRPIKYASITFIDQNDTTKKFFALTDTSGNYYISIITSVKLSTDIPKKFELAQNYPNPFSSSTTIAYTLNAQSDVQISIYDLLGREIKRFIPGLQPMGGHGILWDGKDNTGGRVAAGIYFYKLRTSYGT